ncbi:MAG: YlxR family protein [Synechococcales bacterium]|nr:YlxR family protein [Synechococcales bacterium]
MEPNYRRCLSCRRVAHKDNLWRVVRSHPTGKVQLDQGMGRSAYLCPTPDCLRLAQRKNRMGRVLRASVPDEVFSVLWQRLEASSAPTKPRE